MEDKMKALALVFSLTLIGVFVGFLKPRTAVAQNNTFYGSGALASPSSMDLFDSAFGFRSLNSPTSGTNNTAIGAAALLSNTSGFNETACGAFALQNNTS